MFVIIRDAISNRRKNPAPPGEHLLIDAQLESDLTDDVIFADMLLFVIGAYHEVGYSKCHSIGHDPLTKTISNTGSLSQVTANN